MGETHDINQDITEVLYTREQIHERAQELGRRISEDYCGRDLLLIAILKGAAFWMTELSQSITVPCEFDFMAVSSYGSSTKSSGVVRILKDINESIEGRDVLIVEDVLDSGITLKYLMKNLRSRHPASLAISVLLRKEGTQKVKLDCRYEGFSAPGGFLVGFGLDYAERYRNLPYVGVLDPKVYSKKSE